MSVINKKIVFTEKILLSKLIDFKLDDTRSIDGEVSTIERVAKVGTDSVQFCKTTVVEVDVPKQITSVIGFKQLTIVEDIVFTPTTYVSTISSPNELEGKLNFVERFECVQVGETLVCTLTITGKNNLPFGIRDLSSNLYINKRKARILLELDLIAGNKKSASGKKIVSSDCTEIQ